MLVTARRGVPLPVGRTTKARQCKAFIHDLEERRILLHLIIAFTAPVSAMRCDPHARKRSLNSSKFLKCERTYLPNFFHLRHLLIFFYESVLQTTSIASFFQVLVVAQMSTVLHLWTRNNRNPSSGRELRGAGGIGKNSLVIIIKPDFTIAFVWSEQKN